MRHIGGLTSDILATASLPLDIMGEIRQQLAPYHGGERGITGSTVISDGATIDSLTVMDMIMALEDRFDITIPLDLAANLHTVDQLARTVLDLCVRR